MSKLRLLYTTVFVLLAVTTLAAAPVPVLALGDSYASISVGAEHSMAIKSDGSLWACVQYI